MDLLINITKYILLLFSSIVVGFVLIVLSYKLPITRIYNNVSKSIDQLEGESEYYSVFGSVNGTQQDNYTEAIYLGQALFGERGAIGKAMYAEYYNNSELSPVKGLSAYIKGSINHKSSLDKFWNGWEVPLKVLLQFMDYLQIRYINILLQFLLMLLTVLLLVKKRLDIYVMPFVIACLFMNPVTIGLTICFSGYYYEILASCIIMLLLNDCLNERKWYGLFFSLLGIIAFYFNMNYYQLCTFGFPLVMYFILNTRLSCGEIIKNIVCFFSAWMFGFAGMMIGKWAVFSIIIDGSIFRRMYEAFMYRIGTSAGADSISRFDTVYLNFKEGFFNIAFIAIEIVFLIYIIMSVRKHGLRLIDIRNEILILGFLLTIVVGRYFVEANHSYIHYWVVYRNFAIVVFGINTLLCKLINTDSTVKETK